MKKYYDAMYKAFYSHSVTFYLERNATYALKLRWINELFSELAGVLDVACCDDEVNGCSDFDILLNLRSNLYSVARTYFLVE